LADIIPAVIAPVVDGVAMNVNIQIARILPTKKFLLNQLFFV
jgi:hypothetical protein